VDSEIAVAAADVGRIDYERPSKHKFGWTTSRSNRWSTGGRIEPFAKLVATYLRAGRRVALGFEAPQFVPVPVSGSEIGRRRLGEDVVHRGKGQARPWSADGGVATLALSLQQALYVLTTIQLCCGAVPTGYQQDDLERGRIQLLLWEAFISGDGASKTQLPRGAPNPRTIHIRDAIIATDAFIRSYPRIKTAVCSSIVLDGRSTRSRESFSLVGAAALRAKLSTDVDGLLQQRPIVVKV
jgi:hypothetical protein